jgi:N-acetylneuraminate synthase
VQVRIGDKKVGDGHPVFVIGEIGINHNGDLDTALKLIDMAAECGCDAVKFQMRTPELCVPKDQWDIERDTPWGLMTYLEYKNRIEFDQFSYNIIKEHCASNNMLWSASCWDSLSLIKLWHYSPPFHKIPSALITDEVLVKSHNYIPPIILSTGMSTHEEIEQAILWLNRDDIILLHCNSSYPAENHELNLRCIKTLRKKYGCLVGYSGHERGIAPSIMAVALGACVIERHITLDRTMWGTDQAASLEREGLFKLCRDVKQFKEMYGDGIKRVYDSELAARKRLRGY